MKELFFAATITLSILSVHVDAQTKATVIKGKIISFEESFPLEGAVVTIKGTKKLTSTQADGTFSLSIDPGEKFLVVKLNDYESQEIKLTSAREYSIVLKRAVLLSANEIYLRNLSISDLTNINLN